MAKLFPYAFIQELDNDGNPLAGGKIYTYEAGTSTPKTTYSDSDGLVANTNPIVLDSSGRAEIWLGDGSYKFIIKDSSDVTLKSVDDISGESPNAFGSTVTSISGNLSITAAYKNAAIVATDSATLSLLPAATAGEGFYFVIDNKSPTTTVTIDPDGSETIDGASTISLKPYEGAIIICDGTGWYSFLSKKNFIDYVSLRVKATEAISIGQPVAYVGYNSGANVVEVSLADNTAGVSIGISTEAMTTGTFGYIITNGILEGVDTSSFTEGDILYVDGAGNLTATQPTTGYAQPIAFVLRVHASNGAIMVTVDYPKQDAIDVRYDNTTSGLTATTVQGAIDEIDTAVDKTLIQSGTYTALSGTSVTISSIPTGVKHITIGIVGASFSVADDLIVQLNAETSGYEGSAGTIIGASTASSVLSSGIMLMLSVSAAYVAHGRIDIDLSDSATNRWSFSGGVGVAATARVSTVFGSKALSAVLSSIKFLGASGQSFDAGRIVVSYEY